ncbi:hypothetical protein PIB30_019779 [Stylosanthes scabra]|uniref:Uncharacterized protein n=1 Tax=Stylosanthes scabra TaxID=79078 RepID=A0ABU6Y6J4_9FABA|nr:hypothetical protein [Stylosanthes scabra]
MVWWVREEAKGRAGVGLRRRDTGGSAEMVKATTSLSIVDGVISFLFPAVEEACATDVEVDERRWWDDEKPECNGKLGEATTAWKGECVKLLYLALNLSISEHEHK